MPLDYYLALFQLHIAVIGVVIAGVVALVQLLNAAKPKRSIALLVRRRVLAAYGVLLVVLLLALAAGSWVTAFPSTAERVVGGWVVDLFASGGIGLVIVALMLASLGWFAVLSLQTRTLLDSQRYLETYVRKTTAASVHAFLAAVYGGTETKVPMDPFQPIREYIKDNAFKYYDYGTADGLKHFSKLFDKALASSRRRGTDQAEYERLARYISESCEEFFGIFTKTASEKRKRDTVTLLFSKGVLLTRGDHDASHACLLPIIHGLESIAKHSDTDDEIIAALTRIRQMTDEFFDSHKKHDWQHIAGVFDEICLSVSRISEDYYLQKNNSLKTVSIIAYSTGEYRTVTSMLVDFFLTYRDLSERYKGATPLSYFEAIESVIEVLFVRLGDIITSGQQNIGFNMKYHDLARELYKIYYEFGLDAIKDKKPELLALVLTNFRRVMKPAKIIRLSLERQELCTMFIDVSARGIVAFGDVAIKSDGRTISDYAYETLHKHSTNEHITNALALIKKSEEADTNSAPVKKLFKRIADA